MTVSFNKYWSFFIDNSALHGGHERLYIHGQQIMHMDKDYMGNEKIAL